ncbi:MAG: DUF6089 family protein [Cyclobacteriaceae bacterium]|jgi:hypothetical protein|nr:DUF6089 family protein [Cyclobacteriaceae bacterium]
MMRFLTFVTVYFFFLSGFSQNAEIGFGIGAWNYTGDLSKTYDILEYKPAGTVIYRSNRGRAFSFKASLTAGRIGATDSRSKDALAKVRNASFNIFLYEALVGGEYHFLDWRNAKRPLRFTPYVSGGLALFGMAGVPDKTSEYSNIQPSVQLGMGVKYVINPLWYIGLDFGMRKTFFDYLDNTSEASNQSKTPYRFGNPNDYDNYFFTGITLTRTFYTIPCPGSPYK